MLSFMIQKSGTRKNIAFGKRALGKKRGSGLMALEKLD